MNAEETEELRRLVRRHLAERPAIALNVTQIHHGISRQISCTVPEVEAACILFKGLGQMEEIYNTFGSLKYFKITAPGTLAYERGE